MRTIELEGTDGCISTTDTLVCSGDSGVSLAGLLDATMSTADASMVQPLAATTALIKRSAAAGYSDAFSADRPLWNSSTHTGVSCAAVNSAAESNGGSRELSDVPNSPRTLWVTRTVTFDDRISPGEHADVLETTGQ